PPTPTLFPYTTLFRSAADQVGLPDPALRRHLLQRPGMVVDIEPVADVRPSAIDRKRQIVDRVEDDERDQLLWEMIGAVIVRAVGDRKSTRLNSSHGSI